MHDDWRRGARCIDWTMDEANNWCDAALAEFKRVFPDAQILAATQHSAENSHHMHVFAIPWGRDGRGNLRKGKAAMLRQGLSILTGQEQVKLFDSKQASKFGTLWQDHCERELADPFGFNGREVGKDRERRQEELDERERHDAHSRSLADIADRKRRRLREEEQELAKKRREQEEAALEAERRRNAAVNADIEAEAECAAKLTTSKRLKQAMELRATKRSNAELRRELEIAEQARADECAEWQQRLADKETTLDETRQALATTEKRAVRFEREAHAQATLRRIEKGEDPRKPPERPKPRPAPTLEERMETAVAKSQANLEGRGAALGELLRDMEKRSLDAPTPVQQPKRELVRGGMQR